MLPALLSMLRYTEAEIRARINDSGPIYAETNPDRFILEPFNMASAAVFLLVVLYWYRRLRPVRQQQALLWRSLPILAIGGVGGTVYHGFRSHDLWLLMDWVPIAILTLGAAVYFWLQLTHRPWLVGLITLVAFVTIRGLIYLVTRDMTGLPQAYGITLGYTFMGLYMLVPILLVLYRTGWRHARWVGLALGAFLLALLSRALDNDLAQLLPMGTHFLWHGFGALACTLLMAFVFRYQQTLNAVKGRRVHTAQSALPA